MNVSDEQIEAHTRAHPRELVARQKKVDALCGYFEWLLRKTRQSSKVEITPADMARFIRSLPWTERDRACAECGIRPASQITWERVIENFEADPWAGVA